MSPLLHRLGLPGDEQHWAALGFEVQDGALRIGAVDCTVGVTPSWGFDATAADPELLEIPALPSGSSHAATDSVIERHPNGVTFVDHIVYRVPDLEAAVEALRVVLGTEPRRRFHPRGPDGPEMAFYRVGEAFIEVVAARGKPAVLLGAAFGTPDLDATVAAVREAGGPVGDPKPAVQGGRIAGVWNGHVGWGVAFLQPADR